MKRHDYRITIEPVAAGGEGAPPAQPLTFSAASHDDLLAIIARVRSGAADPDAAAAFALGLKLFGEALLRDRDDPLFAALRPHFGAFMKALKARTAERAGDGPETIPPSA
jgi:hypothetical protein